MAMEDKKKREREREREREGTPNSAVIFKTFLVLFPNIRKEIIWLNPEAQYKVLESNMAKDIDKRRGEAIFVIYNKVPCWGVEYNPILNFVTQR